MGDSFKYRPWYKWFPGDMMRDPMWTAPDDIHGVYRKLLDMAWATSKRPGYFLFDYTKPTYPQIAQRIHSRTRTVRKCVVFCLKLGTLKLTSAGVIYSPRMVEYAEKIRLGREAWERTHGVTPGLPPPIESESESDI